MSSSKMYQVAKTQDHWGNASKNEKVPLGIGGVDKVHQGSLSCDSNIGLMGHRAHPAARRTFAVIPHHEAVAGGGVRFNVEDVEATKDDMNMPPVSPSDLNAALGKEAKNFYSKDREDEFWYLKSSEERDALKQDAAPRIEVSSDRPADLVYAGSDGFLRACLLAFARHLPLALSPDHVWTLVSYAFAKHVDKHAEELRHHFVRHEEGKKRIEIRVDELRMGESSASDWERLVFPQFSEEIRKHVGEAVHGEIVNGFSTTDATARACGEITLMAATKNYFSFGMRTCCGIPSITLLGTAEDWAGLRAKAEALSARMTPAFAAKWMPCLLPILDQFVSAYKGEVDHGFWQSMVKLRYSGGGSGSYSFLSGWVQNLYPYLGDGGENPHLRPWQHAFFQGPEYGDFPSVVSSAPVEWDYFGSKHDIHFHAGFAGFTQHQEWDGSEDGSGQPQGVPHLLPGTIMPTLGWMVTHDPQDDKGGK